MQRFSFSIAVIELFIGLLKISVSSIPACILQILSRIRLSSKSRRAKAFLVFDTSLTSLSNVHRTNITKSILTTQIYRVNDYLAFHKVKCVSEQRHGFFFSAALPFLIRLRKNSRKLYHFCSHSKKVKFLVSVFPASP